MDGYPFVRCTLKGKPYRMLVDTGAGFTLLDYRVLQRLGIAAAMTGIGMEGIDLRAADIRYVPYESHQLVVGEVPILQDVTSKGLPEFTSSVGSDVLGLLGAEVLDRYRGVLDYRAKCLWLKPAPAVERRSGRQKASAVRPN